MTQVQAVKGLWSDSPFEAAAVLQVTGWETIFQEFLRLVHPREHYFYLTR